MRAWVPPRTCAACCSCRDRDGSHHDSLQGHGPGHERPPRRPGGLHVRPDHQHHQPDQGRQNQGLCRDDERLPSLPDVPTMHEAGLPDFKMSVWHALYAPKGTPKPIIDKLSKALQKALKDPSLKQRYAELGPRPWHRTAPRRKRCGSTSKPRSTNGGRSSRKPVSTPTDGIAGVVDVPASERVRRRF